MKTLFKCPACLKEIDDTQQYSDIRGRMSRSKINLHHIRPSLYGGSNENKNTIYLCQSCHAAVHSFYKDLAIKEMLRINELFFEQAFEAFIEGAHGA